MLKKILFDQLLILNENQPWLSNKVDEITNLLCNECNHPDEKDLVFNLLNRFTYISNNDFSNILENIVNKITSCDQYDIGNTIVAATAMGSKPDSSQLVLQAMKPFFQKNNWDNPKLINNADKIINQFPEYYNVIFVDEFIGTGSTIYGRVTSLKKKLKDSCYNNFTLKVYAVATSIIGKNFLENKNIDLDCDIVINRGISDHFSHDKDDKLQLMRGLECILSKWFNNRKMHSLGYGEAEVLYAREKANTPNNVFPVFWWPFYYHNERRYTILIRSMGDA